jgi:uncharacterized protein (DUF302 family)
MARMTQKIRKATGKAASKARKLTGKVQRAAKSKIQKAKARRTIPRAGEAALLAGAAAVAGAGADEALRALRRRLEAPAVERDLGFEVRLPEDHAQAIMKVTDALKEEGFGILTRIDVHVTLKEKIGVDFRPYTILGACNPALAHRALAAYPEVGLLLPCNVTVEHEPDGSSLVRITDPAVMMQFGHLRENAELREVAEEAEERLTRVRHALGPQPARVVY